VEAALVQRLAQVVAPVAEALRRDVPAAPLGFRQELRRLVDSDDVRPALGQRPREAPVPAGRVEHTPAWGQAEEVPEARDLARGVFGVPDRAPEPEVIGVEEAPP